MRQVFLIGNDVSRYISEIPLVAASIGDYGQLVVNEISTITGLNINRMWDTYNPLSPFYGSDPANFQLQIYVDSVKTYDGYIKSIKAVNQDSKATIELRSVLQTALDNGCIYVSQGPESPADAIKNICNLYKITIDSGSFGNSAAVFNANSVFIEVMRPRPDGSVLDLIQQIAAIGCLRLYSYNQILYCEIFQTNTQAPLYTFSDSLTNPDGVTLFTHPETETIQKQPVTGYSVETIFGPVTYGDTTKQGKSISGGADAPVRILSLQAGVFLGEIWIKYLNSKQTKISFDTKAGLGKVIPLGSPVAIEYTLGKWPLTTIDISLINQTDKIKAHIEGITRK